MEIESRRSLDLGEKARWLEGLSTQCTLTGRSWALTGVDQSQSGGQQGLAYVLFPTELLLGFWFLIHTLCGNKADAPTNSY